MEAIVARVEAIASRAEAGSMPKRRRSSSQLGHSGPDSESFRVRSTAQGVVEILMKSLSIFKEARLQAWEMNAELANSLRMLFLLGGQWGGYRTYLDKFELPTCSLSKSLELLQR